MSAVRDPSFTKEAPSPNATLPFFIPLAVDYARAEGINTDELLPRFGFAPTLEGQIGVAVDLGAVNALVDAIASALGDPFFGLHVAVRFRRGTYQLVEFACRNSPNLRGSWLRLARYASLVNPGVSFTFTEAGSTGALAHHFMGLGRHANEYTMALLYLFGREVTREAWTPEAVWFAHEPPAERRELVALFGTERIRFGEQSNGLAFSRNVLDAPITGADPALLRVLETEMERQAPKAPASASSKIVAETERAVSLTLELGPPRIENIAQALGMSVRTLQRRLDDEGTSFQEVVEQMRKRLAGHYAQSGKLSSTQMAFLLGYADVTSFLRAFKRWTGTSPQEYRGGTRSKPPRAPR